MKRKLVSSFLNSLTRKIRRTSVELKRSIRIRRRVVRDLPRPYKANRLSKFLRQHIVKKSVRAIFGANLAAAVVAVSGVNANYHPRFEPEIDGLTYLSTETQDPSIVTNQHEYVVPVEDLNYIGQGFRSGHSGFDLNASFGNQVLAVTNGRVLEVADTKVGYGRYIVINHGSGLISLYAHLNSSSVQVGQLVEAGDQIGQVGLTGWTTGPHLHFEIHDNGIAINPRTYLDL